MAEKSCSEEEFISLFEKYGPAKLSKLLGVTVRNIYRRREVLERKLDRPIKSPDSSPNPTRLASEYPKRLNLKIQDGVVLVGSDAHYWPDAEWVAHRAFLLLAKRLKPRAVVLNGDVVDGATTGRHPKIGWQHAPTVQEELEAVDLRTDEIRAAAKGAALYWTIGNHDMRFESRLANNAGEYEGVKGTRLSDHFPHWTMCWSLWLNNDVVVKHRFKGGVHATHNNALWSGKTMVTGHLHSLKVTPFTDYPDEFDGYHRTRFGVDTGTLNDPNGPHADYDEDNPKNHRSGFAVLTFRDGRLLWPELVMVVDENHVQFRGELIKV